VEFQPVPSIKTYSLEWKAIQEDWSSPKSLKVQTSGGKGKAEAHDLEPGMTYCLRLVCVSGASKGEPGPELIIDTEQVGCTPQQKSGCPCVIQ